MELKLNYNDLSGAIRASGNLADELNQYCDNLSRKVQKKMYDVKGGMSSALNNADYYVNAKIAQLRKKQTNAKDLSEKTQALLDTAKRVDSEVKSRIEAEKESFFQKNPDMRASDTKLNLVALLCDLKNRPTLLGCLIKICEKPCDALSQLGKTIKYWWKCGGGKELVMNDLDIVVKVGLAAVAIMVAVPAIVALAEGTTIVTVVVAAAASGLALIAIGNAIFNFVTSRNAISASKNGDPAMAQIYGKQDTMAQVFWERNFKNATKNNWSYKGASAIEITEAVCSMVMIAHSLGQVADAYLKRHGMEMAFKETVTLRDGTTKANRVTLKSIKKGFHAMRFDEKILDSDALGFRTTLTNSLKGSWSGLKGSWSSKISTLNRHFTNTANVIRTKDVTSLKNYASQKLKKFDDTFQTRVNIVDGFVRHPIVSIQSKISHNVSKINIWCNEFKTDNFLGKVEKVSGVVKKTNKYVLNTNMIVKGLDRTDGKGVTQLCIEKYAKDKWILKEGSIFAYTNQIGLNRLVAEFELPEGIKNIIGVDADKFLKNFQKPWSSLFTNTTKGGIINALDIYKASEKFRLKDICPYYRVDDDEDDARIDDGLEAFGFSW